jgi:hypothetical protein
MHGLKSASTSPTAHISCMNLPQLQAELAIRGYASSGRKPVLLKRLEDALLNSAPNTVTPLTHVPTVGVRHLRTLLKARGLDTSGTKLILCARLEDALLEDMARAIEEAASARPAGWGKFSILGEEGYLEDLDLEEMRKNGLLQEDWCQDITVVNGVFDSGIKLVPFNDGSSE